VTEAETEATHSSPLCSHFLNMLLKHNCTSQKDTVPDKQEHGPHPGTVKRPRATQTVTKFTFAVHFAIKREP